MATTPATSPPGPAHTGTLPRIPELMDWACLISLAPSLYYRADTLDQVREFLLGSVTGSRPRQVRVLGGLHSCSDICLSGTILDVNRIPRTIEFDPDDSAVTVSANFRLHDFLAELAGRDKALPATGGTDEQTLAGLISTNTAPATPHRSMYQLVEWIEYLTWDPSGKELIERRVHQGEPDFLAAVGSLGVIGVITRVRFKLIDQPYFRTVQRIAPLEEMLGDIEATSKRYDFWRIDWLADTDKGLVWTAEEIAKSDADPVGDYEADQSHGTLGFLFQHWDKIRDIGPVQDPIMKGVFGLLALFYDRTEATGPMRNMLPVDRRAPLRVAMAEWSFDPTEINRVLAECRQYFEASGWPNMPIEIELSRRDEYYMSPWNWEGLPCVLKLNFMYLTEVCSKPGEREAIYTHLRGLWNHFLAKGIRFKAHWGKINFMDPGFVRERYQLEKFRPFVQEMFVNPYMAQRLGM